MKSLVVGNKPQNFKLLSLDKFLCFLRKTWVLFKNKQTLLNLYQQKQGWLHTAEE